MSVVYIVLGGVIVIDIAINIASRSLLRKVKLTLADTRDVHAQIDELITELRDGRAS